VSAGDEVGSHGSRPATPICACCGEHPATTNVEVEMHRFHEETRTLRAAMCWECAVSAGTTAEGE